MTMAILRVTSVSGDPDIRAALCNASTLTLECTDERGNNWAQVRLSLDDLKAVVRETSDGQKWAERCMRMEEEAQIRYGAGSEQCGQTPVLPLQESIRLLAADPTIFKIELDLEDDQHGTAFLILRECGTTWILYGYSSERDDYFQVIPRMPTLEEVSRLD
jgi:hypothetical protein